jgi:hypothetical protein
MKGYKPLTVADLTQAIQEKYFHGLETAIKSKQVNNKKFEILDQILDKRIIGQEALKRGIDKTENIRYGGDMRYIRLFVQKVLIPDIKVTGEEMKAYYTDHKQEYTYPEMIKLSSLIFSKLNDASLP